MRRSTLRFSCLGRSTTCQYMHLHIASQIKKLLPAPVPVFILFSALTLLPGKEGGKEEEEEEEEEKEATEEEEEEEAT